MISASSISAARFPGAVRFALLLLAIGQFFAFCALADLTDAGGLVTEQVAWEIGDIKADPLLDVFYVVDLSNDRILAFDASSGAITASISIGEDSTDGCLEFSIDGSKLFYSTPATSSLHKFTTGTLAFESRSLLPQPVSKFVIGSDGFVYGECSTVEQGDGIYRVSHLSSRPGVNVRVSDLTGVAGIYRNQSGTRFFLGTASDTYEIPLVDGDLLPAVYLNKTSSIDFFFQEDENVLYNMGAGDPDFEPSLQNLNSGDIDQIPLLGIYEGGIASRENATHLYTISEKPEFGVIRSLRKTDGLADREWRVDALSSGAEDEFFHAGKFEMGLTGNLLFAMTVKDGTNRLGLLRPGADPGTLAAPIDLKVLDRAYSDHIQMYWSPTADATDYEVYRRASSNPSVTTLVAITAGTEWSDFDVDTENTVSYEYWIAAKSNIETGLRSVYGRTGNVGVFGVDVHPISFASFDTFHDKIVLRWTPAGGLFGDAHTYYIDRKPEYAADSEYQRVAFVPVTQPREWSDTSVVPGQSYIYRVSGSPSNSLVKSTSTGRAATGPPPPPEYLAATDGLYPGEVSLYWGFVPGAYTFTLYRHTENDFSSATVIASGLTEPRYLDDTVGQDIRYYYWVESINPNGTSTTQAFDTGYSFSDRPISPSNLLATDGDYIDRIVLSGYAVPKGDTYDVYRSTTDDPLTASIILSDIATPTAEDLNVPLPDVVYYYWVIAKNSEGSSAFSEVADGFRARPLPGAPSGIIATFAAHPDKIVVSWNPPAEADTYTLYYSDDSDFQNATVLASGLTDTSYDDFSATAGVLRWYWVRAFNAAGGGGISESANGVRSEPVPSPPSTVTAEDSVHYGSIALTWSAVAEANSYSVYRNTTDSFGTASQMVNSLSVTSWTDTNVDESANYFYWVTGTNYGGEGSPSLSEPGSTRSIMLAVTANVSATDGTYDNRIVISWDSANDAVDYRVMRSESSEGPFSTLTTTSSTSHTDSNVVPGIQYFYTVTSIDINADSAAPSMPDAGYRSLKAPASVMVSLGRFQGLVKLSWASVEGAVLYRVFRGKDPGGGDALEVGDTTELEFMDESGTPGDSYYYFVRADSALYSSGFSTGMEGYGTIGPPFRPDAKIGKRVTSVKGDNIYVFGNAQIQKLVSKRLKKLQFALVAQNDGENEDTFLVSISKGNQLFRSIVRDSTGRNVTGAASSGLFTQVLADAAQTPFSLQVIPSKKLRGKRRKRNFTFSIRSTEDSRLTDTARATAQTAKSRSR